MGAITAGALIQIVTALTALLGAAGAITSLGTAPRLRSSIKRDSDLMQGHPGTTSWQAAMRSSIEKRRYLLLSAASVTSTRIFLLVYLAVNIAGFGVLMRNRDEVISASPAAIFIIAVIIGFFFVLNEAGERIRQAKYLAPFAENVTAAREATDDLHRAARMWQVFAVGMLGLGLSATASATARSLRKSDALNIAPNVHGDLIGAGFAIALGFAVMLAQINVRYREAFAYRRQLDRTQDRINECVTSGILLRAGYSPVDLGHLENGELLKMQNELRCKILREQALEILDRSGMLRTTGIRRIDDANRISRARLLHLDGPEGRAESAV